MRSSREAVELIVAHEVTSKVVYEKKYQRPEWPGVQSGITVGIGYDLGYNTKDDILHDWSPYIEPNIIREMQRYSGIRGQAAQAVLKKARQSITITWDQAMAVFSNTSLPKFEAMVLKACPGSDALPAGCFGVLTSITYNRGAGGFTSTNGRYAEMYRIRAHIIAGRWDQVDDEIRSMKRLWPGVPGLLRRRDEEAALWNKSLKAAPKVKVAPDTARLDTGDDRDLPVQEDVVREDPVPEVTPAGSSGLNVQPETGEYSLDTEMVQKTLIALNYHEVGNPNGIFGGKTVAGVAAFMTDRGKDPNRGRITQELKDELSKAKAEGWSRPIAPERANATARDIENKVPAVKDHWWQKLFAYIMGIPTAALALFKDWFGDYNDPASTIYAVKTFFTSIPTDFYLLAIIAIAAAIFYKAKKAQDATVEAYRRGEIN